MELNITFFQTVHGYLKLAQIVCGMIVMICVGSADSNAGGTGFIWFTAVCSFLNSLVIAVLYLLRVPETETRIPWLLIHLGYCFLWTFFYFVSFIVGTVDAGSQHVWNPSGMGAAAFFCVCASVSYGLDLFLYFRLFRGGSANEAMAPTATSAGPGPTTYNTNP